MAFEKNSETEKLQSIVKSCLLEINKLKLDLVKAEKEKNLLNDVNKIKKFESLIKEKEKELDDLKRLLEEKKEIISNNEILIKTQETKIETLENFADSLADIKKSFEKDLDVFKTNELNEHTKKLKESLTIISKKDAQIKDLLKDIESYKEKVSELEKDLTNKDSILELQKIISSKNTEIKELNNSLADESTINSLQDQIIEKDRRINELEQIKNSFNDIKSFLEKDIEQKKNKELEELKEKVKKSIDNITEKNEKIKELIDEINEKEKQIKVLTDNSVSKDTYLKLKQEIDLKNDKIKRLEKIKGLFSDLDKTYLSEKQKINKDVELKEKETEKENKDKDKNIEKENPQEIIKLKKELKNCKETIKDLEKVKKPAESTEKDENQEIIKLKKELKNCKETIIDLEKIENYYNQLISPPKKDLTSFQSQIYNLIPEKKMSSQEIHNYIRKIAFKNLSYINMNNILKNLERKGYFKMEEDNKEMIWTKVEKE